MKSGAGKEQGAITSFQATKGETCHGVTQILTSFKQCSVTRLGLVFNDLNHIERDALWCYQHYLPKAAT